MSKARDMTHVTPRRLWAGKEGSYGWLVGRLEEKWAEDRKDTAPLPRLLNLGQDGHEFQDLENLQHGGEKCYSIVL